MRRLIAALAVGGAILLAGTLAQPADAHHKEGHEKGQGKGLEKVVICHVAENENDNTVDLVTLTVAAPSLKGHLRHGDQLGACPDAGA